MTLTKISLGAGDQNARPPQCEPSSVPTRKIGNVKIHKRSRGSKQTCVQSLTRGRARCPTSSAPSLDRDGKKIRYTTDWDSRKSPGSSWVGEMRHLGDVQPPVFHLADSCPRVATVQPSACDQRFNRGSASRRCNGRCCDVSGYRPSWWYRIGLWCVAVNNCCVGVARFLPA
jgi:hypothetical protein